MFKSSYVATMIISHVGWVTGVTFPDPFRAVTIVLSNLFNFARIGSIGCLIPQIKFNHHVNLVLVHAIPGLILVLAVCLTHLARRLRRRSARGEPSMNTREDDAAELRTTYLSVAFYVVFLFMPNAFTVILQTIGECVGPPNEKVLRADLSIDCNSTHDDFRVFACLMIPFWACIFVSLWYQLWEYKHEIAPEVEHDHTAYVRRAHNVRLKQLSFMYHSFKPRRVPLVCEKRMILTTHSSRTWIGSTDFGITSSSR